MNAIKSENTDLPIPNVSTDAVFTGAMRLYADAAAVLNHFDGIPYPYDVREAAGRLLEANYHAAGDLVLAAANAYAARCAVEQVERVLQLDQPVAEIVAAQREQIAGTSAPA